MIAKVIFFMIALPMTVLSMHAVCWSNILKKSVEAPYSPPPLEGLALAVGPTIKVLIVLLGSNDESIMSDRIRTAVSFVESLSNNLTENAGIRVVESQPHHIELEVDWFLSGGVKNKDDSREQVSEATKMSLMLDKLKGDHNWNYVLDERSSNTAENFVMLKRYLDILPTNTYYQRHVATSDFHYNRASLFFNKIVGLQSFNWVLSPLQLSDSRYWESVHVHNINSDVEKAMAKFL